MKIKTILTLVLTLPIVANAGKLTSKIAENHKIMSTDHWSGANRTVFDFEGYEAWVVEPKDGVKTAEGRPWTWTMQWATAFVPRTSVPTLVNKYGWHHATIITFSNRMDKVGLEISKRFQDYLVKELDFNPKANLIGMSWGGFFSVRYAATYPEAVKRIYLDCPFLTFTGTKLDIGPWGKMRPANNDWSNVPEMPINMTEKIAAAKIPVLLLYGGKDTTLSPDLNARAFIKRMQAVGGDLQYKERPDYGHHPHGVGENDNTIIDFFYPAQAKHHELTAKTAPHPKTFNVNDYGAKGDGKTLDTKAIQRAIDAAENIGGGIVTLSNGTYLSGTIYLKDNLTLQLLEGAVLKGCTNHEEYCSADFTPQNYASPRNGDNTSGGHLVVAVGRKNVRIIGPGKIDGSGALFLTDANGKQWPKWKAGIPWRPGQMVWFCDCENIKLDNVELADSPYWTCFILNCDRVDIRHCRVHNERKRFSTWNGDGLDIDRCRDVTIADCDINTTDDCITLRASHAKRITNPKDCERITVSNCQLSSSCNAIRIGVGEGHIHNATFKNIAISNSMIAVNFVGAYSKGSRGTDIDNITLEDLTIDAKYFLWMYHRYSDIAIFRDIEFKNIQGIVKEPAKIEAKPTMPFKRIRFTNVEVPCGIKVDNADIEINGGTLFKVESASSAK